MRVGMIDTQGIRKRWESVGSKLDERGRRVFAAGEVRAAGWGARGWRARPSAGDSKTGFKPGKPYPNTTEAGFMKVNDNASSQRFAE